MPLNVYFSDDIAHVLVAGIALALDVTESQGHTNHEFLAGVVAMAKYQARAFGVWPQVRAESELEGIGDVWGLLEG